MATKEHKRQAREAIEGLELRLHRGPPIGGMEVQVIRDFLGQNDFSPASDYYSRLTQIQERLRTRVQMPALPVAKSNYGGESAGRFLQVQSVFDHLIVSTCYEGDYNTRHGRIKISHRFNRAGRIDFVELKFLRSLELCLTGEIRKLLLIREYQSVPNNWLEAEAFVLPVLPRELVFLYPDLFRCPRVELLAWLINIGHGIVSDLVEDLGSRQVTTNGHRHAAGSADLAFSVLNHGRVGGRDSDNHLSSPPKQAPLSEIVHDRIAWPILKKIAPLTSVVEPIDERTVAVRYSTQSITATQEVGQVELREAAASCY